MLEAEKIDSVMYTLTEMVALLIDANFFEYQDGSWVPSVHNMR